MMRIPYHLQQIAALGTEHALAPELILPAPFEQITTKYPSREAQLLLSVGGISFAKQAGYYPEKFKTFLAEHPHHGKKVIPIQATLHLIATMRHFMKTRIFRNYSRARFKQYANPHFFHEWCVSFLASDKELPGEILPRLLNVGLHYDDMRAALWFILGERGQELSQERPEKWHWFFNMERPAFHHIYPASSERDELLLRLIHERGVPMRLEKVLHLLTYHPYRFSREAAQSVVQLLRYTWADVLIDPKQFQIIARNFVIFAPLVCQKAFIDLVRERGHQARLCDTLIEVVHFRQEMQRAICA